ncbi:hypothetical protein [Methylobacterium radiodurans]|uniref:hypothetical protein n=1 Tax=Methylobacterium radiodurans TaxID=2202828 RepID=UPI001951D101|nr:hypothetical protein [Methylobacterium radiodurans]
MTEATDDRGATGLDERLARIAELVGRPVETFRVPQGDALGDALELVKLWERIDATGRARLLACARTEATRVGEPQQSGQTGAALRAPSS